MSYMEDLIELSLAGIDTTGMNRYDVWLEAGKLKAAQQEPDDHVRILRSRGEEALRRHCLDLYEKNGWPSDKAAERADRMVREAKKRAGVA